MLEQNLAYSIAVGYAIGQVCDDQCVSNAAAHHFATRTVKAAGQKAGWVANDEFVSFHCCNSCICNNVDCHANKVVATGI